MDDEIILDLSKRYGIAVPRDMADEYEELCPDASTPIAWKRFYDAYNDWNTEYAAARAQALTSFGNGDEVIEVINNLFCDDESEASRFITKALAAGVKFNDDNLLELTELCNEETVKQAVLRSGSLLTEASLEELYGNISDDTLIQVAKAQNALAALNTELRILSDNRSVQLKYSRLASIIDMWFDDDALDAMKYLRIEKAWEWIGKVMKQVENIRQELLRAIRLNDR
mgnify:CR=1 FL=1